MSRCPECGESIPCSGFHPAVTEPTPKPTDALEQMKRLAADSGWPFDGVTSEVAESWIAAWEKERAEHELRHGALMRCAELNGTKNGELIALRAALERIEGEMRDIAHEGVLGAYTESIYRMADALRAAREGGK